MHELTIARKIVDSFGMKAAKEAIVEVGELAEITAEELERAVKQLTSINIQFKIVEAEVECGCGFKGRPKITAREHDVVMFECPKCTQIPDIISGDEIEIKEVL